MKSTVFDA